MEERAVAAGDVFGHWTVIGPVHRNAYRSAVVECRCACGRTRIKRVTELRSNQAPVCSACVKRTHGHSSYFIGRPTPTYRVWIGMRARCVDPRAKGFAGYGGRGVSVCDRWQVFENFLADMGERPSPKHSIDRIDGAGNYEPGNCRWATMQEQCRNRRSNHRLTCNGETALLVEWCERLGLKKSTVLSRLSRGWSPERAITAPAAHSRAAS